MTASKTKLYRRILQHPLLPSLYLPSFLIFFAGGLLNAVTPIYMASFNVDYAMIGLMISMGSIANLIFTLPGGVWIPRLGLKRSMVLGMIVVALGTCGFFYAAGPFTVLAFQFLIGIGNAFYSTARLSYAASATNSQNRGRSLSTLGATNRLSQIISPAVGGFLAASFGLRLPHLFSGVLMLVSALIIFLTLKPEQNPPRRSQTSGKLLLKIAKENAGMFLRAGSGGVLLTTVRFARFILVPIFGSEVLGLDTSQIGLILSLASLVDMLNFYSAGTIMDRFGRRAAAIPCVGFMALGMLIMPFTTGFWGLLAVTALIGFGNGFGSGIMMTMGSDMAPEKNREEFLSIWLLLLGAGSVASPIIVGGISDVLSVTASGFAFFGIGVVSVLAFLFIVPETRDTQSKPVDAALVD